MINKQTNWLAKSQPSDKLSDLLERFFNLLEADFIHLLPEPATVNNAFFLLKDIRSPKKIAEENRTFIISGIIRKEVQIYRKSQLKSQKGFTSGLEHFETFIFLPLYHSQKYLGVLSFHYINAKTISKNTLEQYAREWSLLLSDDTTEAKTENSMPPLITDFIRETAFVSSRKQLFNLFENELKKLLGYHKSTIFILENERSHAENYFADFVSGIQPDLFSALVQTGKIGFDEIIFGDSTRALGEPILSFDQLIETQAITPFLKPGKAIEAEHGKVIDIYRGVEIIGKWVMVFKGNPSGPVTDQVLLSVVAIQLALALTNIITAKKFRLSEEKSEIIQSLNIDFASIRDKNELISIINLKFRKFFDFSHTSIAIINEDGQTVSSFLKDNSSRLRNHPKYRKMISDAHPIMDGVFNKVLLAKEPIVFELEEQFNKGVSPYYLNMMYESAIRRITISPLQLRNRTIGFWVMLHLENQTINTGQVELMKSISAQFSVAVDNILANETIQAKEAETEKLLKLSLALTTIRNKKDLYRVLEQHLGGLIDFEELVIMLLNDDRGYSNFMFLSADAPNAYAENLAYGGDFPLGDICFDRVRKSNQIQVLDMDDLRYNLQCPQYVIDEYNRGIRKKIGLALRGEQGINGIFFINLSDKAAYTEHALRLVQGISYQLSIAVSNILAGEEIMAREKEREVLLSISNDIAAVRDHEQLMEIIGEKLKPQLGFTHIAIGLINGDEETYSTYLTDRSSKTRHHPSWKKATTARYPIKDGIMDRVFEVPDPIIFDLEEEIKQQGVPIYCTMLYESGTRQFIGLRLSNEDKVLGIWALMFDTKDAMSKSKLSLMTGLANQLSIAVSNILANEEIESREAEKTILLSLSNDIASLTSRSDFYIVVNKRLQQIFPISQFGIAQIDEGGQSYSAFMLEFTEESKSVPEFEVITTASYSVDDPIFTAIMAADGPIVLNVDDVVSQPGMPGYVQFWKKAGFKYYMPVALRVGSKKIGFITFHFEDPTAIRTDSILLKGVCSQIAVAVSNILASEEIAAREREREMLLSLSNDIAGVRNPDRLMEVIGQKLKPQLSFTHIAISVVNGDGKTCSTFLVDQLSKSRNHPSWKQVTTAKFPINDGVMDRVFATASPVVLDLDEEIQRNDIPLYLKMIYESGTRQFIGVRLFKEDQVLGMWMLMFDSKDVMNKSKLSLITGLSNQLSIAISNILANEKVNAQLAEIKSYKQQLEEESIYLKQEIDINHNYSEIIGNGPEMQKIFRLVSQVAPSDSTVLILGETGTGKELIARAIHNNSPRKNRLMVKVNCATLPANLIESELFGHERGSFTGATERRTGKFELAHNGTLFLDEIGEMSLELQVKLLRVLQEKEFERIGGKTTIKVDVRIIAATNRDLEKEMLEGRFRTDLYYRLNIFPVSLPPLRSRAEDIPLLAAHFIQRFAKKAGRNIGRLSQSAMQELIQYNWPGNIRELEHMIERSILLSVGTTITRIPLPSVKAREEIRSAGKDFSLMTIDENEKEHIVSMLRYCMGRVGGEGGAAERLGVPTSTLHSKIKRLGIKREY